MKDILLHNRFKSCDATFDRALNHLLLVFGFIFLAIVTAWGFLREWVIHFESPYTLIWPPDPMKWLAILGSGPAAHRDLPDLHDPAGQRREGWVRHLLRLAAHLPHRRGGYHRGPVLGLPAAGFGHPGLPHLLRAPGDDLLPVLLRALHQDRPPGVPHHRHALRPHGQPGLLTPIQTHQHKAGPPPGAGFFIRKDFWRGGPGERRLPRPPLKLLSQPPLSFR